MLLTNIGDLNMRKRILFGSMLVIICMLLLPSTSALQTTVEPENKINLEYIKNIKVPKVEFKIDKFFLKKSELFESGPVYEDIEEYELIKENHKY